MNSKEFTNVIFKAARDKRDEEKIKFITNTAIGYLENALNTARSIKQTKELEKVMSNYASTIQILEKLQDKYLKLMKQNPHKKNMYVKEYYGRASSVIKKIKFKQTEQLLQSEFR